MDSRFLATGKLIGGSGKNAVCYSDCENRGAHSHNRHHELTWLGVLDGFQLWRLNTRCLGHADVLDALEQEWLDILTSDEPREQVAGMDGPGRIRDERVPFMLGKAFWQGE